MATDAKYYEEQIKRKAYNSATSAKQAVSRAGLTKQETQRLHTLAMDVYSPLVPAQPAATHVAPGPTHNGTNELDRLAFQLCMYASRKGVTPQDAVGELVTRIQELTR